jgi:hypothetical protein
MISIKEVEKGLNVRISYCIQIAEIQDAETERQYSIILWRKHILTDWISARIMCDSPFEAYSITNGEFIKHHFVSLKTSTGEFTWALLDDIEVR